MWPKRAPVARRLERELATFSADERHLPGIADPAAREALAMQMVASLRRLEYAEILRNREISLHRADPNSPMFDPERAAMLHARNGNLDEAFWLIFLATHFGKHLGTGWQLVRDVYSGLGHGVWTWERTCGDPHAFRTWLHANRYNIRGHFGNHRRYESLKSTADVVESYITWVGPAHSHDARVANLVRDAGNDPNTIFEHFYFSMNVRRFGRLGKFDFLALIGRLDLAPIKPGVAYLRGATGPLRGARLLFGGHCNAPLNEDTLEGWLVDLDQRLAVGMQVIEDSLCNWQKSPTRFKHFRG